MQHAADDVVMITPKHGRLELIFGPMFSGKTSEMFRRIKRYIAADRSCCVVKWSQDDRYGEGARHASTHDNVRMGAVHATQLADVAKRLSSHDVIGIDEGQFYPDTVEWVMAAVKSGQIVIVAFLDGTYEQEPFSNGVNDLLSKCDTATKLHAVCSLCGAEAPFSRKIVVEEKEEEPSGCCCFTPATMPPDADTSTPTPIDIGGADKYMAVCRACLTAPVTPVSPGAPTRLQAYETALAQWDEIRHEDGK